MTELVGVPQAAGHLNLEVVTAAADFALLFPILQCALVALALHGMAPTAFGTLMAPEPAMSLVLSLLILSQQRAPLQLVAIAAAQRGGHRTRSTDTPQDLVLLSLNTAEPR